MDTAANIKAKVGKMNGQVDINYLSLEVAAVGY